MPFMSALLVLAAAAAGEGARAEDTIGLKTFERYCLDARDWQATPDLAPAAAGELSSLESQAIASHGGKLRVFLASAEPRVLLAFEWEEMKATGLVFRDGKIDRTRSQPVTLTAGRCIVFAHEDVWQGMPEAFERAIGVAPRDISNKDQGLDGLMAIDLDATSDFPREPRASTFGVTRRDGTTLYRAIM